MSLVGPWPLLYKALASKISNKSIDIWYAKALKLFYLWRKNFRCWRRGFLTFILNPSNPKVLNKPMEKHGLIKYSFVLDSGGTTVSKINSF